ncbi:anti-sigma factor [Ornithinimicrobium ciconiae]|uniref:Regulator of SigK n=1 Tax=Ornithinimicrobium ciconiae TaxID=2594265 RepID=A0A516G7T7_9MICO|nr:anti-sigma factor [Ornithinimicrobium ciconiae]QDO87565.1 anti-sigma factor [Ornithinimicrobium ciconiae]
MSDASLHDLAAAYALDAVDDAERAAFEAHLPTCPPCREEVASFSDVAEGLSADLSATPPPSLREQVLTQIAVTPQDNPTPGAVSDELAGRRAGRHRGAGGVRGWVLAAAVAAAVAIGAVAVTQWTQDSVDPAVVAVQEVLDAPDAVRSTESVDGARVTVVTAYSLDRSVLLTQDLAGAPPGQDYQLWFVDQDGAAVSAGLLPTGTDQFLLEGDPSDAIALGITLEPTGGSDQPTSDPLIAIPLQG